jgi:hypothetical protein
VDAVGDPLHYPIDGLTMNQDVGSGGSLPSTQAQVVISVDVPDSFTLEFTVQTSELPANFSNIITDHIYFGASSSAGACAGLFFSKAGLAYTGSVHVEGGNLVLDTPLQALPNSQLLVSETDFWTVRIAVSFATGVVYVYVTKTADLLSVGHQLRYVLPSIPSSSAAQVPPNETQILARGVHAPVLASISSICLGTGAIIPAYPPRADAGNDQALQFCSILELDGSKSFDPQGGALLYQWLLIGGPSTSQFVFEESDGYTYPLPLPTGFTDRLYSASLQTLNAVEPIAAGDVLTLLGAPFVITGTGTDGNGFFVRVNGYDLPDDVTNGSFIYLRQNGLDAPTTAKPTFYPDVLGIFRFQLIVQAGGLFSEPAFVIANVVDSAVSRGCTPDLSFIWNYLSDFWRLLEDPERIEVFWGSLAQVTAAELLRLWQVEYSKSLRDIQRTFQRKWLHYDPLLVEDTTQVELTTVYSVYGGLESRRAVTYGIGGQHLDLQLGTRGAPTVINFSGPPAGLYTPTEMQGVLVSALAAIDPRIVVRLLPDSTGQAQVRIDAPFSITVLSTTTATSAWVAGTANGPLAGAGGVALGVRTYRVDRSLAQYDLGTGDFLCVDGVAYRIANIVTDPTDTLLSTRVTLLDDLPVPASPNWVIPGQVTSPDLDFYNGLVSINDVTTYEVIDLQSQAVVTFDAQTYGAAPSSPGTLLADTTLVALYLTQPTRYGVYLQSVTRRKYIPIDPLILDVPLLQELIDQTDDTRTLRRNVDYFIETFRSLPCLRLVVSSTGGPDVWEGLKPPPMLWAEFSYLDNRPSIEGNFGIPASFTLDDLAQLPSNIDYLSSVQGLWYAYFNGPTVFNLRAGTQILLGLPFAEERGTIIELRDDFSTTNGRILVRDIARPEIVRSYMYPASLSLEVNPTTSLPYVVGDTVEQFAPLVTGVEVLDYIKNPTWFQGYLEQGAMLEVEKFFKFLVRVDSAAFNLNALLFAQSFVLRIKPTYTYPLFVVRAQVDPSDVSVSDEVDLGGTLLLNDTPCLGGTSTMFDQPRAGGGGWWNRFDGGAAPDIVPVYPTPQNPIIWAYDKELLCPEEDAYATLCTTFIAPTLPTMDSIFQFDEPVFTGDDAEFSVGDVLSVPAAPGLQVGDPVTVGAPGTINTIQLALNADDEGTPNTYFLDIYQNDVLVSTTPFTLNTGGFTTAVGAAIPVLGGDILTAFIRSSTGNALDVFFNSVLVSLGQAVSWAYDTALPAGTYCAYRSL